MEKEFGIEEFQSRLETWMASDVQRPEIEKSVFDAVNKLEEIRFCVLEENFYNYGVEVSKSLVNLVKKRNLD